MKAFNLAARLGLGLALATATPLLAADPVEQHNSSAFWFVNWIGLSNATLDVMTPDGDHRTVFAASGTPVFELDRAKVVDGVYRYELSAATESRIAVRNPIDNGRGDAARDTVAESYHTSGQFVVARGAIIVPDELTEDDEQ